MAYCSIRDLLTAMILCNPLPNAPLLSLTYLFDTWSKYVLSNKWLFLSRDGIPLTTFHALDPNTSLLDLAGCTYCGTALYGEKPCPIQRYPGFPPIPQSQFFRYLQIRHALRGVTWPHKPTFLQPFSKFVLGLTGLRKGISTIYSILSDTRDAAIPSHIASWENEPSTNFRSGRTGKRLP